MLFHSFTSYFELKSDLNSIIELHNIWNSAKYPINIGGTNRLANLQQPKIWQSKKIFLEIDHQILEMEDGKSGGILDKTYINNCL